MSSNDTNHGEASIPEPVWITYRVTIPLLCIIGIMGNLLSIVILSRNVFKKSILFAYLQGKLLVQNVVQLQSYCQNYKYIDRKLRHLIACILETAGLALVDIAYLICTFVQCFFVLHGRTWHDGPLVPPEEEGFFNDLGNAMTKVSFEIQDERQLIRVNITPTWHSPLPWSHLLSKYNTACFS